MPTPGPLVVPHALRVGRNRVQGINPVGVPAPIEKRFSAGGAHRGSMPDAPRFRVPREGAVVGLWVENPPRNLLSLSMVTDLAARVADLEKDDSVRAAVLTGAGHANCCAGLDMEEWPRLSPKAAQDEMSRGQDAFWALEHLTKPTIAAIAGAG